MKFLTPLLILSSVFTTLATPFTSPQLTTNPYLLSRSLTRRDTRSIISVSFNGNGCPVGSTIWGWGDSDYFIYLLPVKTFVARSGSGIPLSQSRRVCYLTVEIAHPGGTSFSIDWTRFTGTARLSGSTSGVHQGLYYFANEQTQTSTALGLGNGFNGDYELKQSPAENWSACGGTQALTLANSVRVQGNGGSGTVAGRVDGEVWFEVKLKWRQC